MSKIKIKNFGPIKEGFTEGDGFMEVKKVTVYIGNQGSGKSTVAKVISTMLWFEKALNRGDLDEYKLFRKEDLFDSFEYQRIDEYFKEDTSIEYVGNKYKISLTADLPNDIRVDKIENKEYTVPKIMYVPSERNFLSVVKDAFSVRGLPEPLFEFAQELKTAQEAVAMKGIDLPINNSVKYKYDPMKESGFIYNDDYSIPIGIASSGFQSLVPLFLVSHDISNRVNNSVDDLNSDVVSVNQKIRANNEIDHIYKHADNLISFDEKKKLVVGIISKYVSKCFINIVEEPEQNLFPSSQKSMLESLLEFNNMNEGNKLIMTTHSPYLINYLTLCVKAEMVKSKLNSEDSLEKLAKIVPLQSTVNAEDIVIYELNEMDGTIKKLEDYKGLPSDDNYLNSGLEDSNELFAQLQELEKGWR